MAKRIPHTRSKRCSPRTEVLKRNDPAKSNKPAVKENSKRKRSPNVSDAVSSPDSSFTPIDDLPKQFKKVDNDISFKKYTRYSRKDAFSSSPFLSNASGGVVYGSTPASIDNSPKSIDFYDFNDGDDIRLRLDLSPIKSNTPAARKNSGSTGSKRSRSKSKSDSDLSAKKRKIKNSNKGERNNSTKKTPKSPVTKEQRASKKTPKNQNSEIISPKRQNQKTRYSKNKKEETSRDQKLKQKSPRKKGKTPENQTKKEKTPENQQKQTISQENNDTDMSDIFFTPPSSLTTGEDFNTPIDNAPTSTPCINHKATKSSQKSSSNSRAGTATVQVKANGLPESPMLSPVRKLSVSPDSVCGALVTSQYEDLAPMVQAVYVPVLRTSQLDNIETDEPEEPYKPLEISKTYANRSFNALNRSSTSLNVSKSGSGLGFFDLPVEKKKKRSAKKERFSISKYDAIATKINQEFDDLDDFQLSMD